MLNWNVIPIYYNKAVKVYWLHLLKQSWHCWSYPLFYSYVYFIRSEFEESHKGPTPVIHTLQKILGYFIKFYLNRSPGIYFLWMIFNLAFIQALSALYISVGLLYSAESCISSGPGIYISPAFIWINMVLVNLCTNSIINCNFCISTWNKSVLW